MEKIIVHGVINLHGTPYRDGTADVEIRVPLTKAEGLPHKVGKKVPVGLKIGDHRYKGKLHAAKNTDFAYFSPTLFLDGDRTTLGHVLKALDVPVNSRVTLKVRKGFIWVCDKWEAGLQTSMSRLNRAIGRQPKTLKQIVKEAGDTDEIRAAPHMNTLEEEGRIARDADGRISAAEHDDEKPSEEATLAEKIIRAIADHLADDVDADFQSGGIRKMTGIKPRTFSPILKGMRDNPGTAPAVRKEFRGLLHMIEKGYYRLTEKGKAVVLAINDTETPTPKKGGGGFGDAAKNARIEAAAITAVWKEYLGWDIKSVEHRRDCGYDLKCQKGSVEEHVEVKGTSGPVQSFIITQNEVQSAETNPKWHLCIVTSALSESAKLKKYTGQEFLERFVRKPIQYMAKLK